MAGSKLLRSLSFFLAITLVSYITESAFTGTLTSAGLTFTLPTLSTLTQTQLVYLTAGGLSMTLSTNILQFFISSIRSWRCCRFSRIGSCLKPPCWWWGLKWIWIWSANWVWRTIKWLQRSLIRSIILVLSTCPTVTLTGYDAPSSGYESPSSGGGHGHSRTLEEEARIGPAAPKFHYQWQQNIANLGRRKRATTELEGVNTFLDVRCSVSVWGLYYSQ